MINHSDRHQSVRRPFRADDLAFPAQLRSNSSLETGDTRVLPAGSSGLRVQSLPELSAGSLAPIINAKPLAIILLAVALIGVAAIGAGWL